MNNSNYSKAKVLTLIPIIVLVAAGICMALAAVFGASTDRGALYTVFAFVGLVGLLIAPLPCLVMSVIGTVFASKAKKEGVVEARRFFLLGIVEILAYALGVILAAIMFIGSQGV